MFHAGQAAGVARQTAYRWRQEDLKFADLWDEAIENAVDGVENVVYKRALGGTPLQRSSTSGRTVRSFEIG